MGNSSVIGRTLLGSRGRHRSGLCRRRSGFSKSVLDGLVVLVGESVCTHIDDVVCDDGVACVLDFFDNTNRTFVVALRQAVVEDCHTSLLRLLLFFGPLLECDFQTLRAFGRVDKLFLSFETLRGLKSEQGDLSVLLLNSLVELRDLLLECDDLPTLERILLEGFSKRNLDIVREVGDSQMLDDEALNIQPALLGKLIDSVEFADFLLSFYRFDVATVDYCLFLLSRFEHLDAAVDLFNAVSHTREVSVGNGVLHFVSRDDKGAFLSLRGGRRADAAI